MMYSILLKTVVLPFALVYNSLRLVYRILSKKSLTTNGYILKKNPSGKKRYEHRMVAEHSLQRPLKKWEVVHHINGQREDNSPSNLCVMSREDHIKYHEWYDRVRDKYKKHPRRSTQLKKLKGDFGGQILTDPSNNRNRVG